MSRLCRLLLGITLFCPGVVAARNSMPANVTGVVKKVDIEVGTITIRPKRRGAAGDETFSLLKKDIAVTTLSGEKAQAKGILPGQTVQLKLDLSGDVEEVVIQSYVFLTTVLDVDCKSRTMTVASHPNRMTTMAVDANAKINLAGRPAYLREIKVGSRMSVTASLDGKAARALHLVAAPDGKLAGKLFARIKISRLPGIRWAGVLSEVDPAGSTLRLAGPKTKGLPKTMPVAKEAVIQLMYGQVPMQDLVLKQIVSSVYATVMVSTKDQQITRVFVEAPMAQGTVKALEAERGYLTVKMDGKEKTFALRRDVKVMDKTRVRRLTDLHANLVVTLVLSLDREQLLAIDIHQGAAKS